MSWFDRLLGRERDKPETSKAAPEPAGTTTAAPVKAEVIEPLTRETALAALAVEGPFAAVPEPDEAMAQRVKRLFEATSPVPGSPPQLAMRILNLIAQSDADPAELAKLITLEPALTAAVLRVANSAAFRTYGRIETVRDAITRLGMREVARIGCALSAKSVFDPQRRAEQALYGPIFLELFIHASTTALSCAQLAAISPRLKPKSDLIFLAGLLHDLGKPVSLRILAAIVGGDLGVVQPDAGQVHAILDRLHVEVGAALHREWNLPDSSLAICLAHHGSPADGAGLSLETHAVRLCSALSLLRSRPPTEARVTEIEESARALGMGATQLRAFDADVRRFREMAQELGS